MQKEINKDTMKLLGNMNVSFLRNERGNLQYMFEEQIATQKNLCGMLKCGLNQRASAILQNLETLSTFDRKCIHILKLCEKIEKKIKQNFSISPENALKSIKVSVHIF